MSSMLAKDEIIDPESVAEQFQKQEEIKQKLKQLQAPVFKNFTIKKSKSVMHQNSRPDKIIQPHTEVNQTTQQSSKILNMPNITTISFATSPQKKSTELQIIQSARTLPSFSPLKGKMTYRKTVTYIEQNIQQPTPAINKPLRYSLSQKIKTLEKRNSQTILRKNSLFLVSSLKARYREIQRRAHIGDVDGVSNIKLGNFNQKTGGVTHYQQRFQYMQEAKQRLLLAKAFQGESKLSRISPLLPQPW